MKYPVKLKAKKSGLVIEFTSEQEGIVIVGTKMYEVGNSANNWITAERDDHWEPYTGTTRGDGLSTNYYKLPEGATELKHLIRHKKMGHGIGEAFCAIYRLEDNGERKRNLKKVLFYIQDELEAMEKEENE